MTRPDSQPSRPTWLVVLTIVAMWAVVVWIILEFSDQAGWTLGWIYFGLFAAGSGISKACLLIWNPDLFQRRQRIGSGTKSWDKVWLAVFLTIVFAIWFVAVRDFDMRAGDLGSPGIAWLTWLAIHVSGWTLFAWSSVANQFFETTVRIQTDHGHHVIDRGPYASIRHPGYLGLSATFLATPLLLPSFWMCVLSLLAALVLVIRTALEDRTLQAELPGYAEYATRVRFRLIPGIW